MPKSHKESRKHSRLVDDVAPGRRIPNFRRHQTETLTWTPVAMEQAGSQPLMGQEKLGLLKGEESVLYAPYLSCEWGSKHHSDKGEKKTRTWDRTTLGTVPVWRMAFTTPQLQCKPYTWTTYSKMSGTWTWVLVENRPDRHR
ncbi:unnamed protein product [Dovyalis caffra]|uniref:Uncharacterized protein n=1 Tax=Dovyalis caffra TaxID=77055 RepID=A0AAV1SUI5_9ROSI|nr:unnamed protein product [Dovyalis caffra]